MVIFFSGYVGISFTPVISNFLLFFFIQPNKLIRGPSYKIVERIKVPFLIPGCILYKENHCKNHIFHKQR